MIAITASGTPSNHLNPNPNCTPCLNRRQVRVLFSTCIDAAQRRALAKTVTRLGGAVAPDGDEDFTHFVTARAAPCVVQVFAKGCEPCIMRQALSSTLAMPGCLEGVMRNLLSAEAIWPAGSALAIVRHLLT